MTKSIKITLAISLIFASFGQIASDLYIPSFPNIALDLHTSNKLVQLSFTAFMLSYSISRLFYGSLSDAIGRKKPLIIGFGLSFIGTLICFYSHSISILLLGRLIQGFGAAAGSVLTAAILRDLLDGKDLARFNSYLAFINILFIASPPLIGGYLEETWGWRSTFLALLVYTFIILLLIIFILFETNKEQDLDNLKLSKFFKNIKELFSNRQFTGYCILVMLGYATAIAWLTAGAIIIQQHLNYSPVTFGWLALSGGVAYSIGAIINAKLVMKLRAKTLLLLGSGLILIAGILLCIFIVLQLLNLYLLMFAVYVFYFGSSFIFPSSYAGAMSPFPDKAGLASALLSSVQILGGVLGSALVAVIPLPNFIKLALVILFCGILSLIVVFITTKRYRVKLRYIFVKSNK